MTGQRRPALILAAHGSRLESSNQEVGGLAQRLQTLVADDYAVSHAFLEMARPSIDEAIDSAVAAEHKSIFVLPYFLVSGAPCDYGHSTYRGLGASATPRQ